jgi:class 3 adenylate cyclase
MNPDKYSAYCKEHADEFRDELRDDASRALRNWPGKTAALLLIASSLLSWRSMTQTGNPDALKALFTYAVPAGIAFGYPLASLIFSKLDKHSRSVLDGFLLSILFGFCLTLHYVFQPTLASGDASDLYLALSGQINFVILMTTAFSYHTTFGTTLLRNTLYTLMTAVLIYLIDPQYLAINVIQVVQGFMGGIIVSWLFFARIQTRFYYKSIDADTRQHLYKQLSKLVYPHQLARIKAGDQLEETMPVAPAQAIINVFDVQNSSNIKHEKTQSFFLEVFRAFSQICMMGYEHNPLKSRAFRLKETGDGFISAIGYPFLTDKADSLADHAVETALLMFRAFNSEVDRFGYGHPIKAAMGLAYNSVQGTFQSSGIRAYDLFGDALIQAYRYEELRKIPLISDLMKQHANKLGMQHYNILIVQEVIYNSLCDRYKQMFSTIDLLSINYTMPQDPQARCVYFYILE